MWQRNNFHWWVLLVVTLFIVFAWPPRDDKSLAIKFVNWAADPAGTLPRLPPPLALGQGDDPAAVNAHDLQIQQYDALYLKGGVMRWRLELKVATDPLNPATERQMLTGLGVVTALLVWRFGGPKS